MVWNHCLVGSIWRYMESECDSRQTEFLLNIATKERKSYTFLLVTSVDKKIKASKFWGMTVCVLNFTLRWRYCCTEELIKIVVSNCSDINTLLWLTELWTALSTGVYVELQRCVLRSLGTADAKARLLTYSGQFSMLPID